MSPDIEDVLPYLDIQDTGPTETPEVVGPVFGLTGDPCATNEECDTGFCLTTEVLSGMGVANIEIPDGMCSLLFCSEDSQCGDGARCIDGSEIAGAAIQLCLKICDDSRECRYSGSYACFDSGLEDPPVDGGEGPGTPIKACLPASLVQAIYCGDGFCDNNEKADASLCPLDCSFCGDGFCYDGKDDASKTETAESCPADCAGE